ncbi:MAG: hypothetical protein L3J67_00780 [Hyphomicrobiaceae bacterium]|nr:hypothetical protein [Hyphomicrobiaceae bacterium]
MSNFTFIPDYVLGREATNSLRGLRKLGLPALAIIPMLSFMAYGTGLFPWLGTSYRVESFHTIGSSKVGYSVGLNRFYFLAGQTVFVDYDVKNIEAGKLHILVSKRWEFGGDNSKTLFVEQAESGRFTFTIPESGFYYIKIGGSSGPNGYDLTYSANWGAYFAGFEPEEW